MKTRKPLYIGCTLARHHRLGVHAIVNARGGEQWRNDDTREEVEMLRDARAVRDRIASRVSFYGFASKTFRRHAGRLEHLISSREDW